LPSGTCRPSTTVSGQALTNTFILTYWPLYPAYAAQPQRLFGLSPLADQDAAGLVMMAEQLLTLGTFAAIQARHWLRAPAALQPARHPFAV
jgi:cytochrome c oxidase assembly factor CtaG